MKGGREGAASSAKRQTNDYSCDDDMRARERRLTSLLTMRKEIKETDMPGRMLLLADGRGRTD